MTLPNRKCVHCDIEFTPVNRFQTFCTRKCRSNLGYKKYKKKKQDEKTVSNKGIFRFEDYDNNILI